MASQPSARAESLDRDTQASPASSRDHTDERVFLARIRAGDAAAFEGVFRRHYDSLWRFAMGYVSTRAVAEELVQDMFLQLWTRRDRLAIRGSIKTYLFAAVRNHALNHERHTRIADRFAERAIAAHSAPAMGEPSDLATELDTAERAHAISRAIARLPETRRLVLTLRWDHGMTYPEIAAVAGISVHAAQVAASRAFVALRRELENFR